MTTLTALLLGMALAAGGPLNTVQPAPVDRLSWLAGCWTLARGDMSIEEQWTQPAGGTMLGVGRTIRGGRTIDYEFLIIREVDGELAYVAKPSSQPEATFTLRTITEAEAAFENPEHDFPQRIIYRRTAEGLAAHVEGTRNGQARGVDYTYKRCPQ